MSTNSIIIDENKRYYIEDENNSEIKNEYEEADRSAFVGDYVVGGGSFIRKVRSTLWGGDVDVSPVEGGVEGTYTRDFYKTLLPTGVVRYKGGLYSYYSEEPEVGDKVIVVNAFQSEGMYKEGNVLTVDEIVSTGIYSYSVGTDAGGHNPKGYLRSSEYVVLNPIEDCEYDSDDIMSQLPDYLDFSETDAVNHPNHYTSGRFETIEIIEEITKGYDDGFVSYCVGNSLKYLARGPYKHDDGGLEDAKKARKYLDFAIERLESEN